ncbi:MAG: RteC domain-containing protein [Mangrovibacterium sp.]
MTKFEQIVVDLEAELTTTSDVPENILQYSDRAIGHCKVALDRLRELVESEGFSDKESEILFFKKIKPSVFSKLLYFQKVFDLESNRPGKDKKGVRKYFNQELKKLRKYMKEHQVKVQYYRCGHSHLDEKYFTRNNEDIPVELKDSYSLMDEDFFAWKDHTFSNIMANEMLIDYIQKEMEKLDSPDKKSIPELHLNWTGNKIDLYEMIYAIYLEGSVNQGKATIVELTKAFECMFNIELQKEIYKTQERLIRRKDPVKYLARLIEILRRRINNKLK